MAGSLHPQPSGSILSANADRPWVKHHGAVHAPHQRNTHSQLPASVLSKKPNWTGLLRYLNKYPCTPTSLHPQMFFIF